MRFHLLIALMLCSTLSFAQGTGEVIITEIHNRPQKPTQEQVDAALLADPNNSTNDLDPDEGQVEWFEVYNTTSAPVVMDGWIISDGSNGSSSTISSFTIGPNAYAVFAGYNIPDAHGGVVFDYFYDYEKPSFNNESSYSDDTDSACPDGVILEKGDGTLVDQVLYDYGYGNYIGNPDASSSCSGNAAAIGIPPQGSPSRTSFMLACDPAVMNSADNDLAANWSFSTNVYDDNSAEDYGDQLGTPGFENGECVALVDNDMDTYFSDVDCDDNNADVNPGQTEILGNGLDDDCDPSTLDVIGPACSGEVIITEIHNRPQKPTQEQVDAALLADPNNSTNDLDPDEGQVEWFEVYNTTSAPVVMDGWVISDGSNGSSSTISSFTIGPNAYAVFAGYNIPDAHGGVVFDYFYDYEKPSFNNESSYSDDTDSACPDGVILEKADGTLVDQVLYDYGYGNYIGNADASSSCSGNAAPIGIPPQDSPSRTSFMLACDPAVMNCIDNDLAANWSFSTNVYDDNSAEDYGDQLGTPGQPNDAACIVMVDNDMDTYFSDVDCDDNNADVNPGATEIPYNGIDDDCNDSTLDDDLDEDGFVLADDCDDTNPEVNPGQTEIAYNGIDDDCDDSTLDDDLDEDGFVLADDCNESDPNINPGEEEIVNNGIDDDCNSLTLDSGSEEQIIARGRGALEAQYGSASGNETYTWFDNDGNEVASFIGNSYFSPSAVGCYSALVTDPDVPGMNFFFDEFCITTLDGCCELDED